MLIKVCGMGSERELVKSKDLRIDFRGMIFYSPSPRCYQPSENIDLEVTDRVGVFVNESSEEILKQVDKYRLKVVQLHGNESNQQCSELREHVEVWKAIPVSSKESFEETEQYLACVDKFVFDTKTPKHGGSGQKFPWTLLSEYQGEVPFWLSGGISPEDAKEIMNISHPQLIGVDINSRFEVEPGIKNIERLKSFIHDIKGTSHS